ncbi:transmembrane 9 superfamily member 2-like [Carica papaya]|uniref:transmembrane 9 superfamily member 2-like n=1 Tax=Carica papaya TaxID=3649 RepID=UPI000B8CC4EF|nr:transmembrane 9 superfamily member 2-like [Carica papaya]XP_021909878.1 transmembrane 9 superfamily member 2-like [Carica papaya]XP_021909879.1 transmembrane 9 superfamily member 2-like [Carica papaya]
MEEPELLLVISVLGLCFWGQVGADGSNHRYKPGDKVPIYVNLVGPFHNPSETYSYYDFPFCHPDNVKEKKASLGEVLHGDRLTSAPYKLEFLVGKDFELACRKNLTKKEVSLFRKAVSSDYYFQMYYDDLPIWGFLGKMDRPGIGDSDQNNYSIFNHLTFEVFYNKDRVIEITVRTDSYDVVDLNEDKELCIQFIYTVKWSKTSIPFEKRMIKYSASSSLPHVLEEHKFSITNSSVITLILTICLVTYYIQVIRKAFNSSHDEELADNQEKTGWKNIHGDVFQYPNYKLLFAAALGSGTQLLTIAAFILILGLLGVFYPCNRGILWTALVVTYASTSGVAGYTSAFVYCQFEGMEWAKNFLLTGFLFCGPLIFTFGFLNYVAFTYKATAAMPSGTIFLLVLVWALVALPLLTFCGIVGSKVKATNQTPFRTTNSPSAIPPGPWYMDVLPQMALAGILPFGVIYTELYYIFGSLWGHRIYTIYTILVIVFIILLIVTSLVTIALIYFQLAVGNHQWWWRSFLYGGSVALYVYGYCFFYYFSSSEWSGLLQISFFFSYMACVSYGMFLMLGTVGFTSSFLFIRHIYGSIKFD